MSFLKRAGLGVGLLAPVLAFAQTADPFDTAVTTVTENATGYASALVGIAAAVVVVMIAMKFVKRIKGAV